MASSVTLIERAVEEFLGETIDDIVQLFVDILMTHIGQAKRHNTWQTQTAQCHNPPKVQIVGEDDSIFGAGLFDDERIGKTL